MRSFVGARLIIFIVLVLIGAASRAFHFGDHASDGTIDFGSGTTGTIPNMSLVDARSTYGPHDTMAWIAHFGGSAGTTRLIRTIALIRPGKSEQLVYVGPVNYDDSNVANGVGTRTVSDWAQDGVVGSGQYVMRYYRDDVLAAQSNDKIFNDMKDDQAILSQTGHLLAQGTFTLTT
jgi:hypothetical protein